MKTKFLKIFAPIVALGLLVGALVGVSASANEAAPAADVTPEIISMNVEYGSELYLYYAVDKSTVVGIPTLEVLEDKDGSAVKYTVSSASETEKVNGKECYIFKTAGVAAADVNKIQYVRAVDGDVKGAIREASVEMYLYAKLYKEGYALKTAADGDDYIRRNLYFQLLKYAKYAQELFYFGKDYEAIGAYGVIVDGAVGISTGKVSGNYVKLEAANKESFSYWKVEDISSAFGASVESRVRLYGDGYEVVLANSSKITPVYNATSMEGVEIWDSSVDHFNYLNKSINEVSSGWSSNKSKYEAAGKTLIGENKWSIVNEGDNNVLFVDKKCGGMVSYEKDGKIVTEMTEWNAGVYIASKPTEVQANANVAVLEFDVKMENIQYNDAFVMYFGKTSGTSNGVGYGYLQANNGGAQGATFKLTVSNSGGSVTKTTTATVGEWVHIRVEYRATYNEAGEIVGSKTIWNIGGYIYENDGYYKVPPVAVTELNSAQIGWNARNIGDYYIDNFSFQLIKE